MAEAGSPTLRRRELGQRLRELRQQREYTLEQVSERLLFSSAKLSRLETGARGATLRDIRDLCNLYEVDEAESARLMALARASKERAWWQEHELPYATYIGLEQVATRISEYNPGVIPGLLQTEDYATALAEGMDPKLDPATVANQAAAKITRQEILSRPEPPQLWVIIDEAALCRIVGSRSTMLAQLDRLVAASRLPHVNVQVIPFDTGAHPGLNSNFIILELGRSDASDVVHVEGLHGYFYLERDSDLERYRRVFDQLRAVARSPRDSVAVITARREDLTEST